MLRLHGTLLSPAFGQRRALFDSRRALLGFGEH